MKLMGASVHKSTRSANDAAAESMEDPDLGGGLERADEGGDEDSGPGVCEPAGKDSGAWCFQTINIHTGRDFYFYSDPPHLIKKLRNSFLKSWEEGSKRRLRKGGHNIKWEFIREVYTEDQKRISVKLTKLSLACIQPNPFEKMRVPYAARVFDRRVVRALDILIAKREKERRCGLSASMLISGI